jgi:ArsR family transcriptional regulator
LARDFERLASVKEARAAAAAQYFRANARRWDEIRALYVPESEVEAALLAQFGGRPIGDFLDIGTGTARVLEVFASGIDRGLGLDLSREMLVAAEARLQAGGLTNCQVRRGDMYDLPLAAATMDAVVIHQVLHFADRPARAIAEAARVLRPRGRIVIVDFAPHGLEYLRTEHAHRRLGFSDAEVARWYRAAGLTADAPRCLQGEPLCLTLWPAHKPASRRVKREAA